MGRTYDFDDEDQPTFPSNKAARRRESDKPSEMRKAKRVKFADSEMDSGPDHDSSRRRKATRSPPSDAPKTSEYAYFRNLKNRASRDHSRWLCQSNEQLRSSEANFIRREATIDEMFKPSAKIIKSSCSGEKAGPSNHHSYLSPRVSKYDESDQVRNIANNSKQQASPLSWNVTPPGQSLSLPGINEESRKESGCSEKGIFSSKRNRLRQWAAHTLSSEVEKLHTKGFDLVSSLLTRLFPKDNENDDLSRRVTDNNSKSPPLHELHKVDAALHSSHTRQWDKHLPKFCSGRTREIVLSEWNNFVPESSFLNPGKEAHLQDELMDLDLRFRSPRPTQHDFSFCLPFERYGSSDSWHSKELDEFYSPIERARKEPHRLLLGWDLEEGEDVHPQHNVDNVLATRALHPSSLFSNYYLQSESKPTYHSTRIFSQDFEPNYEEMKYAVTEEDQFSLFSHGTPKCITLPVDGGNTENMLYNNDVILSHGDENWLKDNLCLDKSRNDFWWRNSSDSHFPNVLQFPQVYTFSRMEEAFGERFTTLSNVFSSDHSWSSDFQPSHHRFTNRPLLLDYVIPERSEQEFYFEDE